MKLGDRDPTLVWMPAHCADVINKFRAGKDGKTAWERLHGKKWRKEMVQFGEMVMYRPTAGQRRPPDLEERMKPGRFMGYHFRSNGILIMTPEGMTKATTFNRLQKSERWNADDWGRLKGLPWNIFPQERDLPGTIRVPEPNAADLPKPVVIPLPVERDVYM